jgi:hypothetical protein
METQATLCGVPGRLTVVPKQGKPGLFLHQTWLSERRTKTIDGTKWLLHAEVRFDDNCGNGHNSFAVTGHGWEGVWKSRDWDVGGCIHDMIEKAFPELKHLIRWHFMSSAGGMHYIANSTYLAGNRDHNGLLKGEKRQIINGRTKDPVWSLRADATGCALKTPLSDDEDITNLPLYRLQDMYDSKTLPVAIPRLFWEPTWKHGEGKERDFDAARRCAMWPEATEEQLSLPREELTALLEARAPQLMLDFKADIAATGCLLWEPEHVPDTTASK